MHMINSAVVGPPMATTVPASNLAREEDSHRTIPLRMASLRVQTTEARITIFTNSRYPELTVDRSKVWKDLNLVLRI